MQKIIILVSFVAILSGCKKETADTNRFVVPTITTTAATYIYNTTAVTGGVITNNGGDSITARGVCWDINHNPVVTNAHTSDGTGTGTFSSAITGLLPSTTYYIRAYATNSAGTAYGNEITITTLDHDVYLGGAIVNASFHDVATIWKNGVPASLTDGTQEAYVNCIYVVGSDFYAGGIEHNGTNWVAKFWKNGVPTALTDGTSDATVTSIFVSGADVYVGGREGQVAKIWKNGVSTSLIGGTYITALYVVGTDVYACGDYYPIPGSYAQQWKNGVLTELTDRTLPSNANAIFVSGSDVYVAGREQLTARIWKNGVGTSLSNGTNFTMLSNIYVNGSDVYAGGFELQTAGGISTAKSWKNGAVTTLTDGLNSATVNSIFMFGSDLYVCGLDGDAIKIWKNGVPTIIDITPNITSPNVIHTIYIH